MSCIRREEAEPSGERSSSATVGVRAWVVNDTTLPVISAVAAVNVGPSAATMSWSTNEASDSQVDCGMTTAYGSFTVRNANLVTAPYQTLSGLVVKSHETVPRRQGG